MRIQILTSTLLSLALLAPALSAQEQAASNMDILRDKIKADKKLLIAENLGLTESEAPKFWPLYEEYQKELATINEKLGRTVEAYANEYNAMTLTDEKAKTLMNEALAVDEAELMLRRKYLDKLDGIVPAMKAVRYLQMENKIRAVIRFDLAANIPLVE